MGLLTPIPFRFSNFILLDFLAKTLPDEDGLAKRHKNILDLANRFSFSDPSQIRLSPKAILCHENIFYHRNIIFSPKLPSYEKLFFFHVRHYLWFFFSNSDIWLQSLKRKFNPTIFYLMHIGWPWGYLPSKMKRICLKSPTVDGSKKGFFYSTIIFHRRTFWCMKNYLHFA